MSARKVWQTEAWKQKANADLAERGMQLADAPMAGEGDETSFFEAVTVDGVTEMVWVTPIEAAYRCKSRGKK